MGITDQSAVFLWLLLHMNLSSSLCFKQSKARYCFKHPLTQLSSDTTSSAFSLVQIQIHQTY
jgi:hypothetical protein